MGSDGQRKNRQLSHALPKQQVLAICSTYPICLAHVACCLGKPFTRMSPVQMTRSRHCQHTCQQVAMQHHMQLLCTKLDNM
jgi:hypothetical protein